MKDVNVYDAESLYPTKQLAPWANTPGSVVSLLLTPPEPLFLIQGLLDYRGTSLIRNRPPLQDHHRSLGLILL